ncbi:VOC family protein [Exiguobacterium sp. AM39-5BH]|uniref:VOC family protein n=1 Tax=Exiguobacterium sp. AM39-5BH TaxID=2292355 RepID=UPI000FE1B7C1|nr:VOC family protein [Exiguobacterium sp. AM39-5BH]RHB50430.1 VOC family protein [Exiguobacterium sp. AM39-5BH]
MPINPYLNFNGDCRDAVLFYADVFAEPAPEIMTFAAQPGPDGEPVPDELADLVLHARLSVHGTSLMFSDAMPDGPVTFGQNITLAVVTDDLEAIRREFEALSDEGHVLMPLQETFWSKAYGMVEDRFGVQWQFSHEA